MQITYDPQGDALMIVLRDVAVEHTEEIAAGVNADFDADENIVGIEILDASLKVDRPDGIEFATLKPDSKMPELAQSV